ncbi:hypothetical protein [Aureibacter tunicatorum]|uniref:Uncharacterized protein n=1 Tax=Aureibacter tunicatorum TaxID=866807 RepID=A0AAE3XLT1_9BACT|nr:hypothetical protein [Aureibacter tunicatorum]MDR6238792.1 hypothetical protein [Aureibacter tunicatorum]
MGIACKVVPGFGDSFFKLTRHYGLAGKGESTNNNYGGCLVHMALQSGVGLKTRIAKEWAINWSKH